MSGGKTIRTMFLGKKEVKATIREERWIVFFKRADRSNAKGTSFVAIQSPQLSEKG